MKHVYKAGRKLPEDLGWGISSLLANPQWSATFLQGKPTVTQTQQFCGRKTPFFVCSSLQAAIEVGTLLPGRLPPGTVVEIWEAQTHETFPPPLPWLPHPDRGTEEWFSFWHRVMDYDGSILTPDLSKETIFHRCPVHAQTLLCFDVTVLAPLHTIVTP